MLKPRRLCSRAGGAFTLAALVGLAACGGSTTSADRRNPSPSASPAGHEASAPASDDARGGPQCPAPDTTPTSGKRIFGVNLDWAVDSPSKFAARVGRHAHAFVKFATFPLGDDRQWIDAAIELIRAEGGLLLLTLEPRDGLAVVTPKSSTEGLARVVRGYEARGVPVIIRFAHEMNGSWYAWGQQPDEYIRAFRTMAVAVHRESPDSAMMWAPNYGGGYPFAGGKFDDETLTSTDDPYASYYPGDDAVDWVGMSLYHWGAVYPWGENELPEPRKFVQQLTGVYDGAAGDERAVPNFYASYATARGKPLAITETGALHSPGRPGPSALAIKSAWIEQVYAPATLRRFPRIAMINWFDFDKFEPETAGRVDWTASHNSTVAKALRAAMGSAPTDPACR